MKSIWIAGYHLEIALSNLVSTQQIWGTIRKKVADVSCERAPAVSATDLFSRPSEQTAPIDRPRSSCTRIVEHTLGRIASGRGPRWSWWNRTAAAAAVEGWLWKSGTFCSGSCCDWVLQVGRMRPRQRLNTFWRQLTCAISRRWLVELLTSLVFFSVSLHLTVNIGS